MKHFELLSPAKNYEYAKIAIDHGADAVYMGAPRFGARLRAGNSIREIADTVRYAHLFGAKVYITLNTLLLDEELEEAANVVRAVYNAGVDAVIIQDMGLLAMDLPPVELHASTQCHNNTIEKIQFLKDVGIRRVVLPREFSLTEIQMVSQHVDVELEAFIHGALCVSYSGQCYMSHAVNGRSGNRGNCAQMCRLSYDLLTENQEVLVRDAYLLSLKDFNASSYLVQMMEAGVSSFKIEGRLKDEHYLKNTTSYYRQQIDAILTHGQGRRASSGKTFFYFDPNPSKTFQRPDTSYFLGGEKSSFASLKTQKSMGMEVAVVRQAYPNYVVVLSQEPIIAGDGLCFFNQAGELEGFGVNQVVGSKVYTQKEVKPSPGTILYRNQDLAFERMLKGKTSQRKIAVDLCFREISDGFELGCKDEDGVEVSVDVKLEKELARNSSQNDEQIQKQLSKLGNTVYMASSVLVETKQAYFISSSVLNELRRLLVDKLSEARLVYFKAKEVVREEHNLSYFSQRLDYRGNVLNRKAREFYEKHGVEEIEPGFELLKGTHQYKGKSLMISKYCIRFELNQCPKIHKLQEGFQGKLFLRNKKSIFALDFDCHQCLMSVKFV